MRYPRSRMRRFFFSFLALLPLTLSCARIPPGSTGNTGRLLKVTFSVRGQIQPTGAAVPYHYFVLINRVDTPSEAGPVPVVTRPWGNGFAAASQVNSQGFVGFVLYDAFQGTGGYGVYSLQIPGSTTLLRPDTLGFASFSGLRVGVPNNYVTPQAGENTLTFQIDLGQLPKSDAAYLQVNILATNSLPQGADDAPKYWDALGDGANGAPGTLNAWVTLPIAQNAIRTNAETLIEPSSPDVRDRDLTTIVPDPNLDITEWQIELRNP